MAEEASVSDTQALLHLMLQRLKLQTRAESEHTHTPDPARSPSIHYNGRTTQSPSGTPEFQFHGPTDEPPPSEIPTYLKSPSTPSSTGQTTPQFTREISTHSPGLSLTPEPKPQSRWYLNHHTQSGGNSTVSGPDNAETPTWPWRKKPVQKKLSNSSSVSSTHSIDSLVPPSPTLSSSGGRWAEPGPNRWTRRERERWDERLTEQNNQQERDMAERSASAVPVRTLPTATDRPATLTEEVQPINEGPDQAPASPSHDHMSEPLLSLGSFDLMEEIFTGQEWSKFFLPGLSSQSGSSLVAPEHAVETPGSLSQSRRQEPNAPSQWNHGDVNMSAEGPQQDMDTTDHTLNPTRVSGHSVLPTALVRPGQRGSDRPENMDMSFSPTENAGPRHQSTPVQGRTRLSAGHDHASHEEMSHAQELPHLQSAGGSSLRKQFSLSRKRSYRSERERSWQQGRPEAGGVHGWRRSATPEYPAPSLSSSSSCSSSSSSLQDSMSEGSESSASMAVKKRRVEDTRRVHFAEEVTVLPPLILSDDEDEDGEDDGAEAEPQDGVLEFKDCNVDLIEEPPPPPPPPPRLSVPRWIEALRNKTKRRPRLKLPHISGSRFRIRKKASVV